VVTLGDLVCSPPESQLVSHDSLRSSDGSGFGNSPSTRDTCTASLNGTTSLIATGRCWLDATSCKRTRCTRMRIGGLGPARLMLPKRARPAPALRGRRRPRNSRRTAQHQCLRAQAAAKSGELQRDLRCVIPHADVIAQPLNPVLQLKNLFHAADRSAWFGRPKHAFRKPTG
jgi:hypothetical protein